MKMHENSLFAVLLRSPWWISFAAAAGVAALMRFFVPIEYALFGGLPFAVIGTVAFWRQVRKPGAKRVAAALEKARAMSREEFCAALAAGFRRRGYSSMDAPRSADLALTRGGRVTLVSCRRWKAGRTGVEPLKEFDAATSREGAERMYVALGEVTGNARAFAVQRGIRLVEEQELGELLS
jgi:restriction system protein